MKVLVAPVLTEGLRAWRSGGRPVRAAAVVGALLMAVGLAHGVGFLVSGGPWQGPVSWRKPFAFGLSFGLTTVTVAWVASRLRVGPRARWWLLVPVALSATVEVGWVSVQRARGVASHFNVDTPADELAFGLAGGAAIAVMVTSLVAVTVLSWWRPDAPAPLCLAIRSGLAVLLVAQGVGGWMIQRGNDSLAVGTQASHAIGEAGDLKIVHALAMHGLQVLPLVALWLAAAQGPAPGGLRLVRLAAVGYALLTTAALAQAAAGRAVTEPTAAALAVAGAGTILLVTSALRAAAALRGAAARTALTVP